MRLLDDVRLIASVILTPPTDCTDVHASKSEKSTIWHEDNAVLLHESMIHGHHIYKSVWSPRLGEIASVDREHGMRLINVSQ